MLSPLTSGPWEDGATETTHAGTVLAAAEWEGDGAAGVAALGDTWRSPPLSEPVANNNCNTYYKSVPNALQYIAPRFTLQYKPTNSAVPYKAVHQKLKLS